MNLKVAIYSGVVPSTTFIENLIRAIATQGNTVYLFGYSDGKINYDNPRIIDYTHPRQGWKIIGFVAWNKFRLWMHSSDKYKKLRRHLRNKNSNGKTRMLLWARFLPVVLNLPDVFHIQWAKNLDEWMFLKEMFGVSLVLSLRGTQIKYSPLANQELAGSYRKNFPDVDGFHAVSYDIAKVAATYGATPAKTRVIYSGIDINAINKYHTGKTAGRSAQLNIISVGRMKWIKGYTLVLDALKKLTDEGIRYHYTLVARGDAEEILYQASDLKISDYITIIPGIPQYEVFKKMITSDLLLISSFDEGIANVALEAMALGVPVLSSDCGGMPEVIIDKETGYTFRNRDAGDLSDKLKAFSRLPEANLNQIITNARNYVLKQHSVEQLGHNMNTFYQDLKGFRN